MNIFQNLSLLKISKSNVLIFIILQKQYMKKIFYLVQWRVTSGIDDNT